MPASCDLRFATLDYVHQDVLRSGVLKVVAVWMVIVRLCVVVVFGRAPLSFYNLNSIGEKVDKPSHCLQLLKYSTDLQTCQLPFAVNHGSL